MVTGEVSVADMSEHFRTLVADPAFRLDFAALADFSGASAFAATGEQVRKLALELPAAAGKRLAMVVSTDLHYGFGRMVALMRDGPDIGVQVFRSRKEALAWLGFSEEPGAREPERDRTVTKPE